MNDNAHDRASPAEAVFPATPIRSTPNARQFSDEHGEQVRKPK